MENKNKSVVLPLIIFSNLFPLYGVLNYNWTIFTVVYLYWLELLIVTFFQFFKILIAQGEVKWHYSIKIFMAIRFLVARCGLFLFYWIFIVVFLGLIISSKTDDISGAVSMGQAVYLKGSFYRFTLLSYVALNLAEFFVMFILNGEYKIKKPTDYNFFLDIHIIVVHIVVVLGTFLYIGITEKLHWNHRNAMIATVILFVVVKTIFEVIKKSSNETSNTIQDETGKFI